MKKDKTGKYGHKGKWLLLSKSNPRKVLYIFGKDKPSKDAFMKQERRVQYFKNRRSGPKTVKVKSHRRKGKKVRSHQRTIKGGKISKDNRKIFDFMAKQPREYGGDMDFQKKGKLERFNAYPGKAGYVDMPEDFETQWHVHPIWGYKTPSEDDMAQFIKDKGNQASIIFSSGKAISVTKTPKTRHLEKRSFKDLLKKYSKMYDDTIEKSTSFKDTERRIIKQLKEEGFKVKVHEKGKDINLPIKIR